MLRNQHKLARCHFSLLSKKSLLLSCLLVVIETPLLWYCGGFPTPDLVNFKIKKIKALTKLSTSEETSVGRASSSSAELLTERD